MKHLKINFLTYLQRNKNEVFETEFDGKIVVLQSEKWQMHHFNDAATEIWRLLDSPQSASSLANKLYCTAAIPPPLANALLTWLQKAVDNSLLLFLYNNIDSLESPSSDLSQKYSETDISSLEFLKKSNISDFKIPLFIESCNLSPQSIQGNGSDFQTDNFQTGS